MSKTLVVFGATGQQGTSVINSVLSDPDLSHEYTLRAVTRNTTSAQAQDLKSRVPEVVQADLNDRASLATALTSSHTVFLMTTPSLGPDAAEAEYQAGKNVVDVAVAQGAQYIIFSTLPAVSQISRGKYTAVTPFDAKARIEAYIRTLDIKSAFYSPGFFMENFQSQPFLLPRKAADGVWYLSRPNAPGALVPYLDAVGDTGKFIGAILAEPEKFEGRTLHAAVGQYTLEEVVAALSKATKEVIVYKQVTEEEFKQSIPFMADVFTEAAGFTEEFGYFGPGSGELVAEAAEKARGRLSTLEEFLEKHPLQLT